jgi:hypothetical protein
MNGITYDSFYTKSERSHTFCSELTRAWTTPGMVSPYVDVQQLNKNTQKAED